MTTTTLKSLEKDYTGKPAYSNHPVSLSLQTAQAPGHTLRLGSLVGILSSVCCDWRLGHIPAEDVGSL